MDMKDWVYDCVTPVSQLWEKLPTQIALNTLAPIGLFFEPVQCLSTFTPHAVKTWGWYRVCIEVLRYSMFGCLKPVSSFNLCTVLVPMGLVFGDSSIPRRIVDNVSYRIQIIDSVLPEPSVQTTPVVYITSIPTDSIRLSPRNSDISLTSPHQSPSTDSFMHFNAEDISLGTDAVVEQILLPNTVAPTTDLFEQFAQLRASISQLSIKQLRTQSSIGNLQNHLLSIIDDLDKAFANARTQQDQDLRGIRAQSGIFSTDLDTIHKEEFLDNAKFKRDVVVSTIGGKRMFISEEISTAVFSLPTEGLVDVSELLDRMVTQMKIEFSDSGVPVKSSCKMKSMNTQYSLLNDIIAKALTSKAGSFDAVTQERFLEAKKDIGDEEEAITEAKMAVVMEARTAAAQAKRMESARFNGEAVVIPATKNKRTTFGRVAPTFKTFTVVPVVVEVVPIQMVRPSSSSERKPTAAKRKMIVEKDSDSEDAAPLRKKGICQIYPGVYIIAEDYCRKEAKRRQQSLATTPSLTVEEPVSKILWSQNVDIRGVDEHQRSLPQIALKRSGSKF
ncbi:5-methyltetrahydropteroyltriglutamate--homocysteine methyltransferase [Dorcoceras hygrometricum]|uniref:5-methyltetrahydropteroyltriglutamate--homocysteine methyltransferase n=1 Tax=Dorcoceras hygrometricum TaxID=472368 RepID=A0A2Z7CSN0_9LAMI|nr:5-methyltetrahydropteroyltriglutamate--homocysteine methyltransferase [Dorcoceras hygrometricum]